MKKLLVFVILCALLLSLGMLFPAAKRLYDVSFYYGWYLGGDSEAYSPVGDITVAWRPNISSEMNLADGDLADWYASGLTATVITPHNMITWTGKRVVTDFKITAFSAADADFLYLAFDIVDSNFVYGEEGECYNGDAIQLSVDFGNVLGDFMMQNPDLLVSVKNSFYSFTCISDGAPIQIMRQESIKDGLLTEANGDGVKGAAKKTELGWSVEFALSWQLLYDDYLWRAWKEDPRFYVSEGMEIPLRVGACLYYLNRSGTPGDVDWAAGTLQDWTDENGHPAVTWTCYDDGIMWKLPIQEGMSFNCDGIVIYEEPETETSETEDIETETVEEPTEPSETETGIPEAELPLQTETALSEDETLFAVTESSDVTDGKSVGSDTAGCASAVSLCSLATFTALAAVAYALKKK